MIRVVNRSIKMVSTLGSECRDISRIYLIGKNLRKKMKERCIILAYFTFVALLLLVINQLALEFLRKVENSYDL